MISYDNTSCSASLGGFHLKKTLEGDVDITSVSSDDRMTTDCLLIGHIIRVC